MGPLFLTPEFTKPPEINDFGRFLFLTHPDICENTPYRGGNAESIPQRVKPAIFISEK